MLAALQPPTDPYLPPLDALLTLGEQEDQEVWAQNRALVALAELDPAPVIGSLVPLLEPVFAKAGAAAIAPLQSYLADPSRWAWGHSFACDLVAEVAEARPELRGEAAEILAAVLRQAETRHELAVSGAVSAPVELRAVDMLPLIRHAFEVDKVDPMLRGSWGDIQQELGVTPSATDPLGELWRRSSLRRKRSLASTASSTRGAAV